MTALDLGTRMARWRGEVDQALASFLPSDDGSTRLVDAFLASNTFTEKQVGQAMGAFIKAHGDQVDKGQANQLLRKKLTGK